MMKRTLISAVALLALGGLTACESKPDPEPTPPATTGNATPDEGNETVDPPVDEPTEEPTVPPTDEPTEEPTEEPTDEPVGTDARFKSMSEEITVLVNTISGSEDDADPTNTDEANKAAGLDESTPLVFGDYTTNKDGSEGSFCLLSSANDTYFVFSYQAEKTFMGFGDGECSYEKADAVVVGDVAKNKWSKGGELMGKLTPLTVMGAS